MNILRTGQKHLDINSTGTSQTFDATEEPKPSAPIEEEEVREENFDTCTGYTPKLDYKPKFTPKPRLEGDAKPP